MPTERTRPDIFSNSKSCNFPPTELEDECEEELYEACKKGDFYSVCQLLRPELVNQPDAKNRFCTPLHYACGSEDVGCVEQLSASNRKNTDGEDVLPSNDLASYYNEIVLFLLKNKADPNVKDIRGFTPLHEAASHGKADICIILLLNGALADSKNEDGRTPADIAVGEAALVFNGNYKKNELLDAAKNGDSAVLTSLLTPFNLNCQADDGRRSTPLHLASGYNRSNIVEILLNNGADVHITDIGGLIPLHNACSYGHLEVVLKLLKAGSRVDMEDLWRFTPVHEAVNKMRWEAVKVLIGAGADPTLSNGDVKSPVDCIEDENIKHGILFEFYGFQLYRASKNGDICAVQKILSKRNAQYYNPYTGDTALHSVARCTKRTRAEIASLLIKNNCSLTQSDIDGFPAAHVAANMGAYDVLNIIMQACVKSINFVDANGRTILHLAALNADTKLCRQSMHFNIRPDIADIHGQTARDLATNTELKKVLEEYAREIWCDRKRDVNLIHNDNSKQGNSRRPLVESITDTSKSKPLVDHRHQLEIEFLEAAKSGNLAVVERIYEKVGRKILNCKDADGRQSTALHFAAGYNRVHVLNFLLQHGADVEARDTGRLVPLHNACAYGHLLIAELLLKHGANINVIDRWGYTPLHEAALKGKFEVCKMLLSNGANPNIKGRDDKLPLDVVKEDYNDVVDLLSGEAAVLDAAKKGDIDKLRKILIPSTVNCRDSYGRNSTPLHLASGYNNVEVARFLLESGAEVNATDKGGLIPLHNASSFGHMEIASLLIEHGADINRADKWGYTPLHEASQKGRTQICCLLLNNGADVTMKTNEGQTALEIANADDTKELLMNASAPVTTNLILNRDAPSNEINLETGNLKTNESTSKKLLSSCTQTTYKQLKGGKCHLNDNSMRQFLLTVGLDELEALLAKERISLDILAEMSHDDLKAIGIDAFGIRFKLLKAAREFLPNSISNSLNDDVHVSVNSVGATLINLKRTDPQFQFIVNQMNSTIVAHKYKHFGGIYTRFEIIEVQKIVNNKVWKKYLQRRDDIAEENNGEPNEKSLFHGSPFVHSIVQKGFDERHSCMIGMFGAGIYFAENSSKSNQYVFGTLSGCCAHRDRSCYICTRCMLMCRVLLGRTFVQTSSNRLAHSPPGHHSVTGQPSVGGSLSFPEYVIYRGEQAYPEYIIVYRIMNDS